MSKNIDNEEISKCSFCNKQEDGDVYLYNDAKTVCICQSCAKLFANFIRKHAKKQNVAEPVEVYIIGNSSELSIALFYTRSESGKVTWAYYCGDDGVGGYDSGFMKLMVNDEDTEFEHHYFSFDSESFHEDKISGNDVEIPANKEDASAFAALTQKASTWVDYDADKDAFVVLDADEIEGMEVNKRGRSKEIYSADFDFELALELDKWPLKFHF